MEPFINSIVDIMGYISGLGNFLMMPLVLTALCIVLGMNVFDAVRHSARVGVGFIGFTLVNDMVVKTIGPAVSQMVEQHGMSLNTLDLGWTAVSTITYATELGALIIIFGLILNIILILLRVTRTLDVDLWNYWQWALTGSFIMLLTNSFWWGLAAALVQEVISLLIADASAEMIQDYIDMPGISIPHSAAAVMWLMALPIIKLWDVLGWKSKEPVRKEETHGILRKRLLDPILIGLFIGLIVGLLAYARSGMGFRDSFQRILSVGMASAGMIGLMPKAVSVLLDGINPISEQARKVLHGQLAKEGRVLYIGVDSAVMAQDETTLIVSTLMIPVSLILASLLPGNTMIPFASLTGIVYLICTIAPLVEGDFLKLFFTSCILVAVLIMMGSNFAPEVTRLIGESRLAVPEDGAYVSFLANPITWAMVALTRLF
ncbi:MAG: hypothetical protein J7L66_03075 [Anaerolineaceae bacterium]|nr:hypothetical protein [Anaerolineaceae bacterium]